MKLLPKQELDTVLNNNHYNEILTEAVIKDVRLYLYEPKETIAIPESETEDLSIIVSGRCEVKPLNIKGKQTILTYLYPGDMIGDIEHFTQVNYLHYVYADTEVKLLKIPVASLERQLECYVPFLHFLIDRTFEKLLNHSFYFSNSRLNDSYTMTAIYIEGVSERLKSDTVPFTYDEAAEFIGISKRQLQRIIGEYRKQGILEKKYRTITIKNRKKLKDIIKFQ